MQYRNRQLTSGLRPCPTTSGESKHAAKAQPMGLTPYVLKVMAEVKQRELGHFAAVREVFDYIKQQATTVEHLSHELKLPKATVLKALSNLRKHGLVRNRRGEWGI